MVPAQLVKGLAPALVVLVSACAPSGQTVQSPIGFTTELSEATTDSAAHLADATTQVSRELLEPFEDLAARMAPGGGGRVSRSLAMTVFVLANHDRLRIDSARGGGEHLAAFATLAGIPADQQADLFGTLQERYERRYPPTSTASQSADRFLSASQDARWKDVLPDDAP